MDGEPSRRMKQQDIAGIWRRLNGLLVAQAFGQFNDQAWKQVVTLLAMAAVVDEAAKQEKTALAQIALMLPLPFFSLPAGVLADRRQQAIGHRRHEGLRAGADARRRGRALSFIRPAAGRR